MLRTHKKEKAKAPFPHHRGLWSGVISFGLVNIPVRVVSAKEQKEIHFTLLDPSNLSPIGYKYYNKTTGEEVSHRDAVKAYEYKPDSYVIMTEADFQKANPKATQTIDIENFVALDEIDPVFFEKAYYLLPNKGGEKAYSLLVEALLRTHKVAIAKIVLHTKQHLVALIPRGKFLLLELLNFAEDVKELRELGDWKAEIPASKTLRKEVEMAEKLIQDMTSRWEPQDYEDTYRADIMRMVKAKVKAGRATEISQDFEEVKEEAPQVRDLMPLLRKSLAAKKSRTGRSTSKTLHS
ncbi:MAG: non-homologous end joining protein Ku [Pseudobdellovibrionaceae bacterium]